MFKLPRHLIWSIDCSGSYDKLKQEDCHSEPNAGFTGSSEKDLIIRNEKEYGSADSNDSVTDQEEPNRIKYSVAPRVYCRRWVMLGIFCAYSFSNAFQWIHLNIIGNILIRYYNESLPGSLYQKELAIDWLSIIYMLAYIPAIIPATWLLDSKGLRVACITGSALTVLGTWLKCAAVDEYRFPLLMVAQIFCAIANAWILGLPPTLAAYWFSENEVSTATALGVFANQFGIAIAFVIPPEVVHLKATNAEIAWDLSVMFYVNAAFCTLVLLLIVFVFQNSPPVPPSRAQQVALTSGCQGEYWSSLKRLLKSRNFLVLMAAYGFIAAVFYSISTLLNSIVLSYYPDDEANAGRIGLTLVLAGFVGSISSGVWLDKTKTFKGTSLFIYVFATLSMVAFTTTAHLGHIWTLFLCGGLLGLFMTGYLPVGLEFGAEITFPEPEGNSSALLNAAAQFVGVILTLVLRVLIEQLGPLSSTITLSASLFIGTIITAFISPEYRRQNAGKSFYIQIQE